MTLGLNLLKLILLLGLFFSLAGCSVRQFAVKSLADSLAGSGDVFASDDDPQLVRDAVPFSLKLMESVLAETPQHQGLLTAATSGFTQYAYAFVLQDADRAETRDIAAASTLRDRARKLLLRARNYGLRGLDSAHKGFSANLRADPRKAVGVARKSDVPLLYWTAAAWGSAIAISKNDPGMVSDQVIVESLIDRALALDESWDQGAIHAFLITYEPARQGAATPPETRVRKHYQRAVELSGGKLASVYVAMAESVSIQKQDRAEFETLLKQALDIDVNAQPKWRLQNIIMQDRARWLMSRKTELFVE